MKLEVHERIALSGLLPTEGTFEALTTIRRARESFSFTPDEIEFFEIKTIKNEAGQPVTQWNSAKAAEQIKDIPVDQYITTLLQKKLAEIDRKGNLNENLMSVFQKFVVMYQ